MSEADNDKDLEARAAGKGGWKGRAEGRRPSRKECKRSQL